MKIFLPGPTEVRSELLAQTSQPMIGHHTTAFASLIDSLKPRLGHLLGTQHPVFLFSCTASTALEAALCNAAGKRTLILANGGFGERWLEAAGALGLPADGLLARWGDPIREDDVASKLEQGDYETLVMVHGESSTGMLNPIDPITRILSKHPQVLFILDAVATLGGVPLRMDQSGIDVLVGASQKCLALPPGLVPVGVSARALERSRKSERKGYSLDFNLWQERWTKGQTVGTPAIPQFFAVDYQLKRIEAEGLERRWERHQHMLEMTTEWAKLRNLVPLAPGNCLLPPISCFRFKDDRDTTGVVKALEQQGYLIDDGYGKLKGKTLRIGHMGDWTEEELKGLLRALDGVIG
ncbi:MAG: alanine--glyoxylate aminotransferase family protein [bacterium]|nr:alanine--glyoxylate aminotransferase family protein [bacterium]